MDAHNTSCLLPLICGGALGFVVGALVMLLVVYVAGAAVVEGANDRRVD